MKETVNVAAVQMDIAWIDSKKNVEKMLTFIDQIASVGPVDLVVFPELANTGYVKSFDSSFGIAYLQAAETVPGPTTDALSASARKHGIHIVVGICQLHPKIPATIYNSAVLIGPTGDILGVYHKMHLAFEEKHYFCPGNIVEVFNTDLGCLGLVICYDLVFPELARVLALKGAEIICACFNAPKREPFVSRFLEYLAVTRANENKNFVIACNRVGVEDDLMFYGRSAIAAPRNENAEILTQSVGETEEVLYASLERKVFLEGRVKNMFKDRRPEMYTLLCQSL